MMRMLLMLMVAALAGGGAAPSTQPSTRPALEWGKASEGVQSALVAKKTVFAPGERIGFTFAVRNAGKRDLFVVRSQVGCEIEVDGKWYQYFGSADVKASALGPGREYDGIELWLDADWAPLGDYPRLKRPLAAGKHTLRVAVIAQNEQMFEPVARAVSGEVAFEVK